MPRSMRRQPQGDRKVGQSVDLDALAANVGSLNRFDPSPERAADGAMTAATTTEMAQLVQCVRQIGADAPVPTAEVLRRLVAIEASPRG
jgi:hypothetical protein